MKLLAYLVLIAAAILVTIYAYPRPADTTEPGVLAGEGAAVDYCTLPELSGLAVRADDIPKAYTPGCGFDAFPLPVLARCTEPLSPGAPDLRGLWKAYSGMVGHVERIEQCGNRVVVTSSGVIHDMRADGTFSNGVNDINARCRRIFATAQYVDGALVLHPFGQSFVVVTRKLDGDELVWGYPGAGVSRMKRICRLAD